MTQNLNNLDFYKILLETRGGDLSVILLTFSIHNDCRSMLYFIDGVLSEREGHVKCIKKLYIS